MNEERNRKINSLIVETLCVEPAEVVPTASLRDDLCADSMDMAGLAVDLEERFDIRITDTDGDGLKTVQDVYDLVNRRSVQ